MMSFFTDKALAYLATLAAVVALAFGVSQCSGRVKAEHRAEKAEKAVERTERDLRTCRGNTDALKASIAAQNAAVDALKREGEARVAESRKAASQARAVAESYRKSAAAILAAKPKGEACEAAAALIAETVG